MSQPSHSAASRRAVLFAWSFPEERSFADGLSREYDEILVCPLRYAALLSARRLLPANRVLDVSRVFPAGERAALHVESLRQLDAFRRELMKWPGEPWLAALHLVECENVFYAVSYWRELIARIARQAGPASMLVRGPDSLGALGPIARVDVEVLDILLNGGVREGVRGRCARLAGRMVNRFPRPFLKFVGNRLASYPKTPCLVAGLQETDGHVQAGVVRALLDRGFTKFRWVVPSAYHLPAGRDESASASPPAGVESRLDRLDQPGLFAWKSRWWHRLSDSAVRGRIVADLRPVLGSGLDAAARRRLAELMMAHTPAFRATSGLRADYHAMDWLLRRYDPRVIIASSPFDWMGCVREWARHHARTFVRLPHGAEYVVRSEYRWDADRIVVMGRRTAERLAAFNPAWAPRIAVAGGVHLAEQARRSVKTGTPKNPSRWKACFILAGSLAHHLPDSFSEVEADAAELAGAMKKSGGQLCMRSHPRTEDFNDYRLVCDEVRRQGHDVVLSDRFSSLGDELAASEVALIRTWSGAGVIALYAGIPLIGWTPRPGITDSDEIVNRLPLRASTAAELAALVERLIADPRFREESSAAQRAFLDDEIEDPFGDPYARAVDEIIKACRERS